MRLVRSRAAEWGIDPNRVGIMGFSAGGEVVSMVAFGPGAGRPETPPTRSTGSTAGPDFLIDDLSRPARDPRGHPEGCSAGVPAGGQRRPRRGPLVASLFQKYRDAGAPVEAHVFARGGHAFNMGNRSKLETLKKWPQRLADWMADNGLLAPSKPPEAGRRD